MEKQTVWVVSRLIAPDTRDGKARKLWMITNPRCWPNGPCYVADTEVKDLGRHVLKHIREDVPQIKISADVYQEYYLKRWRP